MTCVPYAGALSEGKGRLFKFRIDDPEFLFHLNLLLGFDQTVRLDVYPASKPAYRGLRLSEAMLYCFGGAPLSRQSLHTLLQSAAQRLIPVRNCKVTSVYIARLAGYRLPVSGCGPVAMENC